MALARLIPARIGELALEGCDLLSARGGQLRRLIRCPRTGYEGRGDDVQVLGAVRVLHVHGFSVK